MKLNCKGGKFVTSVLVFLAIFSYLLFAKNKHRNFLCHIFDTFLLLCAKSENILRVKKENKSDRSD